MNNKTKKNIRNPNNFPKTYRINISGIVQGVGFRPFIYRLAEKNNISGTVTNTTEGISVILNISSKEELNNFILQIKALKPSPALIEKIKYEKIPSEDFSDFIITKSTETAENFQLISPDIATCSNCIEDINNNHNKRRYYYPFTNCTNCGPRFTIIKKMPYDRPNTTMSKFNLCPECKNEYLNAHDRRFHAQPNACIKCGPKLLLVDKKGEIIDDKKPIISASGKIKSGFIIGLKSLGGFQIACDATSDKTVKELRNRKKRPFKPFAIMIENTSKIKNYFFTSEKELKSLSSSKAPIVLLKKRNNKYPVSEYISFNNKFEGVMIPYTPIHHLLFNHISIPLVMTSGNITEEPIAYTNKEALDKLKNICDFFLIHDRDIYSRYDDSVIKIVDDKEMIIRRARGYAPYPVKFDKNIGNKIILAVGAHEKNTFCFLKNNYGIISQHIGDLDSIESLEFFKSTLKNYKKLFNMNDIDIVAYDKHPDYTSTKFAKKITHTLSKISIQHHKAHIASVIAENRISGKVLGFAWDGTGYGDDGKIWGSEIFTVDNNMNFNRMGHLSEKILPGGEITIKKPYRMALSYLYNYWREYIINSNNINNKDTGININLNDKTGDNTINNVNNKGNTDNFTKYVFNNFPFYKSIMQPLEIEILQNQLETGFNSPVTTSMGRFFDAVSSILNLTHCSSYEGEAAINLEMISDENIKEEYDFKLINTEGKIIIDDLYIFNQIIKDIRNNIPKNIISSKFHNTLATVILKISKIINKKYGIKNIALSGGVFQNNLLLNKCYNIIQRDDFKLYSNFKVPVNDGGISLGQAYLAAYKFYFNKERK